MALVHQLTCLSGLWIAVLLSAGAASQARAAQSVGIYSGSFDPPHAGHLKIIHAALKDPGLRKLYVLVNSSSSTKDFKASLEERKSMVEVAVSALRRRVEVLVLPYGDRETFTESLKKREKLEALTHFAGEDSFGKAPADARSRDRWVVMPREGYDSPIPTASNVSELADGSPPTQLSSTRIRQQLERGDSEISGLPAPVLAYVRSHGLYAAPKTEEALKLRRARYRQEWKSFETYLASLVPASKPSEEPEFVATQSERAWIDKFVRWALDKRRPPPNRLKSLFEWAELRKRAF